MGSLSIQLLLRQLSLAQRLNYEGRVTAIRLRNPFPRMRSFSEVLRLTLAVNTSYCFVGDLFEQAAVDGDQHPQRGLAVFGDVRNQVVAGAVELACAIGFERPARAKARGVRSGEQFRGGQIKLRQIFFRQIDAAHAGVFFHVANDVGELKSQPASFGERFGRRIAVSEDVDADQSDYRRNPVAVEPKVFESLGTEC